MKIIWINETADILGPLLDGVCRRLGAELTGVYRNHLEVIADLQRGTFPAADVILTEGRFPHPGPTVIPTHDIASMIKMIRSNGCEAPIIVLDTYEHLPESEVLRLRGYGAVVDREQFRMPIRAEALAKNILAVVDGNYKEKVRRGL